LKKVTLKMDLGRDVITKAIDGTEAERAFQPWWVTVQHYLVYALVILGLIALPINCMLSTTGNCSYDSSHPHNFALPWKICSYEGGQVIVHKEPLEMFSNTLNYINQSMIITASYSHGNFLHLNVSKVLPTITRTLEKDNVKFHLQKNAEGCYVKKNPRLFPFHIYWDCVNQLSWLVLYFPYLIFGLALLMVLLERLLTRFFWTGQRIERFYNLLVKDAIKDGVSLDTLYSRESRLACQQVLYDFRGSSLYYQAYIFQTIAKFVVASLVISWSMAKQCNKLRDSYRTTHHSCMQGYWHQCTIPANGLNLVIFDVVNGVLVMIMISSLFTLLWYIRILLPWSCASWVANTKLGRVMNVCREEVKPFPRVIEEIYYSSLDMRLLLNILTETNGLWAPLLILSLFDPNFRQLFNAQLAKVSSTTPNRGRRNVTIKWQQPTAAHLVSGSVDKEHMMYVADLSPPSDPEETVKMVSACTDLWCEFQPDMNNNDELEDAKSVVSNPDKDITVVECEASKSKLKKKRSLLHWSNSAVVGSPYQAVFKNLRVNVDYTIKLNFIMAGHTLGIVSFTLAAENRKLSTETTTSSVFSPPRKFSDTSSVSDTTTNYEVEFEPDSLVKAVESQDQFSKSLNDLATDQLLVLVVGASWCPVCMKMKPALDKLARHNEDVVFIYADTDIVTSVRDDYGVVALPTIFIIRNQQTLEKLIGNQRDHLHSKLKIYRT